MLDDATGQASRAPCWVGHACPCAPQTPGVVVKAAEPAPYAERMRLR
jgi:hypothetical protein